ncbi:MAG TPA: tripartite tricarboxylate transporter substrate binding protein [Xanthobacteraceae bacterium]|nr:tripartite tricarboxylate transporter substrate binding protein [Xanthobacteraceae bacterium]
MIRLILSTIIASWLSAGATAQAQGYPDRPIKLVVPFPAGGATDTTSRLVAQRMQQALGQTVIIENQGGAGGSIGARQVANAAPDGYTLLMGSIGTFGTQPLLYKLDYDPHKAFTPVATTVTDKIIMVVRSTLQVKTVQELVQLAKANPGKLNYGNAIGIGPQLVAELFKIKAGVNIVHIPYRGGAPMISDLLAGQIDMAINGKSVLLPHIQAGKLRALAVTGPQRWPDLPDVPTLVEAGYLDAPYDALFGVVAPKGTPAPIIDKLNAVINEGLRSPDMRASFAKLGIEPTITTPEEFAALLAHEVPKWADVVRTTGVKVD